MRQSLLLAAIILLSLVVAGCNFPSQSGASIGPQSWIDAPQQGSTIPLAPYKIVSHASDLGGISQIELYVNGALLATVPSSNTSDSLVTTEQLWTPPLPGTYQLQVHARSNAGVWGDYAMVTVIVEGEQAITPTLVETLTPSITSTPTLTLTATPTPTAGNPTFTLTKNAFCRKGPDVTFPDVTAITAGEVVNILGVSEDGYWYFVDWERFGARCWVAIATGQANGDLQGIPVRASPNTPVPIEVPTEVPTNTPLKP